MIANRLKYKIFEAFFIERWTDLIRPFHLVEMDMASSRMIIAYIIAKYEEERGRPVDWKWMIYASLFDLLKKIALCDIKSPVLLMIKTRYKEEYQKLNDWVILQYKPLIDDEELLEQFRQYLSLDERELSGERLLTYRVFNASHKYASLRELMMISPVNERERWERIEKEMYRDLVGYLDLWGLNLFLTRQKPFELLMKIEQLRFQVRWNQTPRIPSTSVLGHCYFVAVMTLLLSRDVIKGANPKRLYDNFFCALFHDLPEAVTRDIISPVKQATDTLPNVVKLIEDYVVEAQLAPFMEDFYRKEIKYFISDEFSERVRVEGEVKKLSFDEISTSYNSDEYSPVDGSLVRLCDHLAAFMEAKVSIDCGVTSGQLVSGMNSLKDLYKGSRFRGEELFS